MTGIKDILEWRIWLLNTFSLISKFLLLVVEILNSVKNCLKMVTNIFKILIFHFLSSSKCKNITKRGFHNWFTNKWMLGVYNMKMDVLIVLLIKPVSMLIYVEKVVDQIQRLCLMKFIEFCLQMESIFALLMVFQTID